MENVTALRPSTDDYVLMVKTKCNSCHEEHDKLVGIKPGSKIEMQGGKGVADLVMKCHVSSRGSWRAKKGAVATVQPVDPSFPTINAIRS